VNGGSSRAKFLATSKSGTLRGLVGGARLLNRSCWGQWPLVGVVELRGDGLAGQLSRSEESCGRRGAKAVSARSVPENCNGDNGLQLKSTHKTSNTPRRRSGRSQNRRAPDGCGGVLGRGESSFALSRPRKPRKSCNRTNYHGPAGVVGYPMGKEKRKKGP